jgi:hypothetical protein
MLRNLKRAVFERCDRFSVSFPFNLSHCLSLSKFQALRRTGGNAGRLQAFIDPVFTVIAFYYLTEFGMPLRRAPWAGGDTGFASDAELMVDKDDAILRPLLHRPGWTGSNTPGIFTVIAEHEDKRGTR